MSRPVKLTVLLNPDTGDVQMSGPLTNLPLCNMLLMRAQAHLFARALEHEPGPARKVKTLDEVGVAASARRPT